MKCQKCGNELQDGEPYVEGRVFRTDPLRVLEDLTPIAVHITCPLPRYVPPPYDPVSLLMCTRCEHAASQHGLQFDPRDGAIVILDGLMLCTVTDCNCQGFTQNLPNIHDVMPELHWGTET